MTEREEGRSPSAARSALPPVVALLDPSGPDTDASEAPLSLHRVRDAVAELDPFARRDHWVRATQAATVRAAECATLLPVTPVLAAATSPVQTYFRVRFTSSGGPAVTGHLVGLLARALCDLRDAPMAAADLVRLRDGVLVLVDRDGPEYAAPPVDTDDWVPNDETDRWMFRWIVAHQLHAALVVEAVRVLRQGIALTTTAPMQAAHQVQRCAQLVRAFPAARAHALTIPADVYHELLRPSMLPPLVTAPLSGRMHTEYRAFRRAIDGLISALPQTPIQLAGECPPLALARDAVLEADLIDAERHVTAVEALVGGDRSLIQTSKSADNAVSVLRRIRDERARRAGALLRFPSGPTPDPA